MSHTLILTHLTCNIPVSPVRYLFKSIKRSSLSPSHAQSRIGGFQPYLYNIQYRHTILEPSRAFPVLSVIEDVFTARYVPPPTDLRYFYIVPMHPSAERLCQSLGQHRVLR